jgi:AsmA protein
MPTSALSVDRLVHKDLKTGPSRLSLKLEGKIANITLEEMQLYGGRGRGQLRLDGRGEVPVTGANLTLDGVSALPLLKDALGFDWLEGRSTIALALAGQGVSERQMIETLNGKVDMATVNGAINGIDVGKLLRNIERGRFGELGASAGEKTASASSPAPTPSPTALPKTKTCVSSAIACARQARAASTSQHAAWTTPSPRKSRPAPAASAS